MRIQLWISLIFIYSTLFAASEAEIHNVIEEDHRVVLANSDFQNEVLSLLSELKAELNGIKQGKKSYPRNCFDILTNGDYKSGIKTVYPYLQTPETGVEVLCDQQTDGGGWTVFQTRENLTIRENFYRNWTEYSAGFGNMTGEFWMGLNLLNVMTKHTVMDLRIDMMDDTGEERYAKYESFSVESEDDNFKLNIGGYSGTASDSLSNHNQNMFSTFDRDNDERADRDCAKEFKGAWWYHHCHNSNLNGYQHVGHHDSYADGIIWFYFRGNHDSLVKTRMMFRPDRPACFARV